MFSSGNKVDVFQPMSSRSKPKWRFFSLHGGVRLWKIKPLPLMGVFIVIFLFFLPATVKRQYLHTQTMKNQNVQNQIKAPYDFELKKDVHVASGHEVDYLPRGIVQATSDMELKPLWVSSTRLKDNKGSNRSLLAMPVGIRQKQNVDLIVRKFFAENFTIVLFHYDGNVDGWNDLEWCSKVIHIAAANQTKWWYAKRFLHPDIISLYDYLFLWDEDLGVENFHPGRYLSVIKDEELEISQPALDTHLSSEIHHGITMRNKSGLVHRRTYGYKGSLKCSEESEGPPCTGWVEGMAPVFSRAAWRCAWHLIQNDLVHGWGMDMKLGYCAQGDPTKKVGVVDSEYIVHQGIPSLGGGSLAKKSSDTRVSDKTAPKGRSHVPFDPRTQVRRQASSELEAFTKRWNQATQEDKNWMDPFSHNESGDETTMGNGDVVSSSRRSQKVRKNNTDRKRFFPQRHRPK